MQGGCEARVGEASRRVARGAAAALVVEWEPALFEQIREGTAVRIGMTLLALARCAAEHARLTGRLKVAIVARGHRMCAVERKRRARVRRYVESHRCKVLARVTVKAAQFRLRALELISVWVGVTRCAVVGITSSLEALRECRMTVAIAMALRAGRRCMRRVKSQSRRRVQLARHRCSERERFPARRMALVAAPSKVLPE